MSLFLAVVVGTFGTTEFAEPSKFHQPHPSVMPFHGAFSIRLCRTDSVSAKYAETGLLALNSTALSCT